MMHAMRYPTLTMLALSQLISTACHANPDYRTHTLLDGLVSIDVPAAMKPMPPLILKQKYPGSRRPPIAFSTKDGSVSIALNYTNNHLTESGVDRAHRSMSDFFYRTYPLARWHQNKITTVQGRKSFVFELTTPATNATIHNLIYGIPVNKRLLLVTFNTTLPQRQYWLPLGRVALNSLRID